MGVATWEGGAARWEEGAEARAVAQLKGKAAQLGANQVRVTAVGMEAVGMEARAAAAASISVHQKLRRCLLAQALTLRC